MWTAACFLVISLLHFGECQLTQVYFHLVDYLPAYLALYDARHGSVLGTLSKNQHQHLECSSLIGKALHQVFRLSFVCLRRVLFHVAHVAALALLALPSWPQLSLSVVTVP